MKLKALAIACFALVISTFITASSASAVSCPAGSLRDTATSYAECNIPEPKEDDKPLMQRVVDILNIVAGVVGIAAIAVIIVGGILFVVSLGDAPKVARARNTILYGVVGLVVSLLAFAVVNFVLTAIFKTSDETSQTEGGDGGEGDN